ncbi:hypothetical protein GGF46_000580 [Coemansia sp. RSA 552]|nr:hypothetical protein GGF46_000580 [Coemansia sp. RSA 552]
MTLGIKRLKVRQGKVKSIAPCAIEMAAVTGCWAGNSVDDARCLEAAKALTLCMQGTRKPAPARYNINKDLARLNNRVLGK